MRTRTKYEPSVYAARVTMQVRSASRANVNSPWSAISNWNNTGLSPDVLMSDAEEIITDDPSPSRGIKYVHHTKRKFARVSIQKYAEFTNTNYYEYKNGEVHNYSWGEYGRLTASNISVSYPKTVSQLKSEAMHKFHQFNEVDTLLNLLEADQLKQSSSQLIKLMKEHAEPVWTRTGRRRKNALGKIASSGFLAWSFGIAPLLSDINKINRSIARLKDDMDRYVRESSRKYTVSAFCHGAITPNISAPGYSSNPNANDASWWHVGIYPTTIPRLLVGCRGTRNVEYNTDAFKRLDYVIKRFIATGPASLGWEKIPFSFMLDWFVNLSGVVDALDNALTGNSRHIDAIWMSEKWDVLVPVYKHKQVNWTSDSDGKQTALNTLSYYHREAISADPSISLSGRFGKKQLALTAALLHQLVANLRVWR